MKATKHLKALKKAILTNKLALIQLLLTLWLVYRVELLHAYYVQFAQFTGEIAYRLLAGLIDAKEQFATAIESITSLFGGSGS